MELCLFFMPQCMPYDPYPALPYLTGYLRKRNVDVQQFDANHGFYEYLLEKKNLIEMSKLVKQDFAELLQRILFDAIICRIRKIKTSHF